MSPPRSSGTRRGKLFLTLGVIVLGIVIAWFAGAFNRFLIGKGVTLTRVTMSGEPTTSAVLSIPYSWDSEKYTYVNAAVDLNKDGVFAPYAVGKQTQDEWVVQNMSGRVLTLEGNSFGFSLRDTEAGDRKDLSVIVVLTKAAVSDWTGESVPSSIRRALTVKEITADEVDERMKLDPTGRGETGPAVSGSPPKAPINEDPPERPPAEGAGRGEAARDNAGAQPAAAAVDDYYDVFHANVPDMTQGKNECVPTSTANSLLWMAEKYQFMDKMPRSDAEIIAELKEDMKWKADSGVATDVNFIPGKNAFVKRHDLPLVTHRINQQDFDLDIMKKIGEELKKGQDVEISFQFGHYDAQGRYSPTGGHMVTGVGVRRIGGAYYLDIHDPLSRGPGTLDTYKIDGTRVIDYRYQGEDVTYIRAAIAESPIEPPATEPPAKVSPTPPSPEPAPSNPATPTSQSGSSETVTKKVLRPKTYAPSNYHDATHVSMKVLVLNGKQYPLYQFYGYNDPSDCAEQHYHASMVGIPAYSLEFEPLMDPEPTGCGFGEIAKLPVDKVILTGDAFHALYNTIQKLRLGN